MTYPHPKEGIFLDRPNRFLAHVEVEGKAETVHVKNTGRCRELLLPGSPVILNDGENESRKTRYDLVAVKKPSLGWVNIDSQIPNALVKEWLESSPKEFLHLTLVKPEYPYGNSRMDFYLEQNGEKALLEVKGCTLEKDGIGYFPDAPTLRGAKHLKELSEAVKEGYESYLCFVIAMPKVRKVLPNSETDPNFATALENAKKNGVKILCLPCRVEKERIEILKEEITLA